MDTLNVLFVLFTHDDQEKVNKLKPNLQKFGIIAHSVFWKKNAHRTGLDLAEAHEKILRYKCKVVLLKGSDFHTTLLFDAVTAFKRMGCIVLLIEEDEDWPARNLGEHGRMGFILKPQKIAEDIRKKYKPREAV